VNGLLRSASQIVAPDYCPRCGRCSCHGACSALPEFASVTALDALDGHVGQIVYHLKRRGHVDDLCQFYGEVLETALRLLHRLCRAHHITRIVFAPVSVCSLASPPFHPNLLLHERLRRQLLSKSGPWPRYDSDVPLNGVQARRHHVWGCSLLAKSEPSQSIARRHRHKTRRSWVQGAMEQSAAGSYWKSQSQWRQPIVLQQTDLCRHQSSLGDGLLVIDDVLSSGATVSRTAALCDRHHQSTWHCFALARTLG
jgi:predicted amidophosphoribosyltransferase